MNDARVAVLGFPTDSNSSHLRGPARAPEFIRRALADKGSNPFTERELDTSRPDVYIDFGNAALAEDASDVATIEASIEAQLAAGRAVLSLGGDHSITYPILRAYAKRFPGMSIVHFDAHPDLYPIFEGNELSHACPFARILENTNVKNLMQIGIRTMSPKQRAVADKYGVRVFAPSELERALCALPSGPVYVTLDMDGLDPAFAPGVSHREPGGLTVREVLAIVSKIPGRIVGADVVELNPNEDVGTITATVAAKFAKEFIGRLYTDAADPR